MIRGLLCWLLGHKFHYIAYKGISYAYCDYCLKSIYVKAQCAKRQWLNESVAKDTRDSNKT